MKVRELIRQLIDLDMEKEIVVYDVQDEWKAEISQVVDQDNEVLIPVR